MIIAELELNFPKNCGRCCFLAKTPRNGHYCSLLNYSSKNCSVSSMTGRRPNCPLREVNKECP